ncbi:DNA repair protein RecO [Thiospirochaeta perfilievii]|uniref:DNA repair protein RecO n=1 Tax=Thiospirochaeta perfilievii TaxID=252967 RepID=A0A5C1QER0_9SPIO|nr:DNA repair protein RecO [Thiospirochaeta perfilievii]QEN05560.1 DNA repair protein RecO [Thiospirochaeta perfilievii]
MERNIKIDCITLKKLQLGENNIGVSLLTSDNEVLFVMAFGAMKPKSKLFSGVNPFVEASWDLYYDPVKEYYRAKEVVVNNFNQEIQLSLESYYTASLFLEIILKSQGSDGVYPILKQCLYYLSKGENSKTVLIQFLLRVFLEQGLLPSFNSCSNCYTQIEKESLFYPGDYELHCCRCNSSRKALELNPGILRYCINTPTLDFNKALRIGLGQDSLELLKKYLLELIKNYTGGKLLTLNSSNGLI